MFTIIGGDGKEYGPVAANQIREWIAAGRASLDTKAKAVGTEEWRLLAQLLDNVIGIACALPGLIMIALAVARAGITVGGDWTKLATAAGFAAGFIVACFALFVLAVVQLWMLVTRGQTIGKRVLGIRIVSFEDETNPGFVKVFLLRGLVPAIIGAVPYLGMFFTLTDICFIFRDDRRCIHDIIAGTKVIKG
ncbi:MAG: RDD family protein [Verrucomicrobia bacterium]|nr:RDD family protein [Verrucomicrobiota bacterium]